MRLIFIFTLLLLVSSCTKQALNEPPLKYSFLPDKFSMDSLFVGDTTTVEEVAENFVDFPSMSLDTGTLYTVYGDSLQVPTGVLISNRKAALYNFYRSKYQRYQVELYQADKLLEVYYKQAKNAEHLYQEEIVRLRKKAERNWFEKNAAYIGFSAGVATAILTQFAVFQASY